MEPQQVKAILAILSCVFPNLELTPERIWVWEELLEPENFEDIRAATMSFLRSKAEFPPTPGQLITLAAELRNAAAIAAKRAAEEQKRLGEPPETEAQRQKNLAMLRTFIGNTAAAMPKV